MFAFYKPFLTAGIECAFPTDLHIQRILQQKKIPNSKAVTLLEFGI